MKHPLILRELKRLANPEKRAVLARFFKTGKGQYGEDDKFLGVMVPQVRATVKAHWADCTDAAVDALITSPWHEARLAGLLVLLRRYKSAKKNEVLQEQIVDEYLGYTDYINNWDLVDLGGASFDRAYAYDAMDRLVSDGGAAYVYDAAGNRTTRTGDGGTVAYALGQGDWLAAWTGGAYGHDAAGCVTRITRGADMWNLAWNGQYQLVSSTTDGKTTRYAYDAAGRLVREGDRTYRYGYLDKVLSVTEGARTYTYDYHVDGQLARAVYGNGTGDDGRARTPAAPPAASEDFLWDGLALIKRGDERFVNEPHVGGGNPVASSKGTTYFNDILGTTVGIREGRAPSRPKSPRYSAAALTAFGESLSDSSIAVPSTFNVQPATFFTGKPEVAGLGHAFLFRNYRAGLAKWQTSDLLGYPDGWNQLAYCGNGVTDAVDLLGCATVTSIMFEGGTPSRPDYGGETSWGYRITNIDSITHSISVELVVRVAFAENLKDSSDFSKGDIVTYLPHAGTSGGVLDPSPAVREAVVAHEYGHANYVTSVIRSQLQSLLRLVELKWIVSQWSEDHVRSEVDIICNEEKLNSLFGFYNAANAPTISWFESSPEWICVRNGYSSEYWAWKKE